MEESFVENELFNFIRTTGPDMSISGIDDIVLSYMISVLETLGMEQDEANFDACEFSEVMSAYMPGFSEIDSAVVCEWMFNLADKLSRKRRYLCEEDTTTKGKENFDTSNSTVLHHSPPVRRKNVDCKDKQNKLDKDKQNKPDVHPDENSCSNSSATQRVAEDSVSKEQQISLSDAAVFLMDMFPHLTRLQVDNSLFVTKGDIEQATQILLTESNSTDCSSEGCNGNTLYSTSASSIQEHKPAAKKVELTDKEKKSVKNTIVSKYSYVEETEEERRHRPFIPKEEPKRLTRYLDNKVVNTKGERYTDVKKEESEEMKATYINLKPARKYRFH